MFPNGTKSVSIDEHGNTLTGIMIPSSTIDRTMVYCHIVASGNQDNHISLSSTTTGRTLCDTETNPVVDSFAPIIIPAGVDVIWDKGNATTRFAGQISYVDYNLASTTNTVIDTSEIKQDLTFVVALLWVLVFVTIINLIRLLLVPSKWR